jgi:multidrug resistance efflux pump
VTSIDVVRGQAVKPGDVLVRMYDTAEAGRLRGLDLEFERKLVAYLQTPADPTVRQALSQIVSERESVKATVEARVIRARRAGIVKEVMVRNGQRVDPGKVVLSIVERGAVEGLKVLAFLPGGERPRLRANQELQLILPGYRGARITSTVRAISDVLPAGEARGLYLGDRAQADSLPLSGTVVVVEGILATAEFEADGQTYTLSDGMIGRAEVQLASHSVLESLLPGQGQ